MTKPNVSERILFAGLETLYQKGFNATSVQDITQAAGVPKGSFYNHFESKEALGAEVVAVYAAEASQRLAVLQDESMSPLARLQAYFKQMHDLPIQACYRKGCMLGNFGAEMADHSELIRAKVDEAMQVWTASIAEVVQQAQDSGEVKVDVPAQELASFLIDAWQGALVRAKVAKDRAPLDAFLNVVFTSVLA